MRIEGFAKSTKQSHRAGARGSKVWVCDWQGLKQCK